MFVADVLLLALQLQSCESTLIGLTCTWTVQLHGYLEYVSWKYVTLLLICEFSGVSV